MTTIKVACVCVNTSKAKSWAARECCCLAAEALYSNAVTFNLIVGGSLESMNDGRGAYPVTLSEGHQPANLSSAAWKLAFWRAPAQPSSWQLLSLSGLLRLQPLP